MGDETYNGWANRETWAFMLHVNNDQGLYEMFRERVAEQAAFDRGVTTPAGAAENLARELLDPDEYRETFGAEQPADLRRMAFEVGSLWRVDWSEVVQSLTED